jgi:hypothetical protein
VQFQSSPDGTNWTSLGAGVRVPGGWRINTSSLSLNSMVRAYGFASGGRWNGSLSLIADVTPVTAQTPPVIHSGDASFGFQPAGFGFNWSAIAGQNVVIEGSTDMANWLPLQTNIAAGGAAYFVDPGATNSQHKFYRLRAQ